MWVYLVVIILSLLWKDITCQESIGYSIQVNRTVTVEEGLCVTIHCNFTADGKTTFTNSRGYWRSGFDVIAAFNNIVSTREKQKIKQNFQVTGNPDNGDCTLTITDARKEDRGPYYFRFEEIKFGGIKYGYGKTFITVQVTDLTQKPEISSPGKLISGKEVTLTCSPPGNCPGTSPDFQWTKSNQNGIWGTSPTVTFTPSQSDHNKSVTCEVTFPRVKSTKKTIDLDVHYPPSFIITTGGVNGKKKKEFDAITVMERDLLKLICSVDSNPAANVTWMKGENIILSNVIGQELMLSLENITSNDTDTYSFSAWNEYGRVNKSVNVTVQYPPRKPEVVISSSKGRRLDESQSVTINEDESLTLNCSADGNPTASVSWIKGHVDVDSNGRGMGYSVLNITSSQADTYRCLAWNRNGVREKRIQLNSKQDSPPPDTNDSPSSNTSGPKTTIRDIMIGMICGMGTVITIILMTKLIAKKKLNKKAMYESTEEPPPTLKPPADDSNQIYMNVSMLEQRPEEIKDTSMELDSNGITADQEEVHYSTLLLTTPPSKVSSSIPETEYAEINVK